jgi:hypothetical protein
MRKTVQLLLLMAGLSAADVYRDAGSGLYPFLKMDVGARAAALGGTGAVNGYELAVFSNPALLPNMEPSICAGHNQSFGTTSQNFVAAVAGLGSIFTGSIAFQSVSTSGIEYRESPTSDPVDTFTAADFSFNGAVAAGMGNFDAGVGMKIIHEKVWLESSNGWAADMGIAYHPHASLLLTAVYLHAGPSVTMADESFRLPRTWILASRWNRQFPFGDLSISGQVMRPLDNRTRAGFGLEYNPVRWASLRGGWKLNDDSSNLTAGVGLSTADWALDYAFLPGDYSLGASHRFTLSRSL